MAILAELVDWRHGLAALPPGRSRVPAPAEAVDPVCGMTVAVAGAPTAVRDGVTWYFCSAGCRDHFQTNGGQLMPEDTRPEPPDVAGEAETLSGFLDFQRATLLWKLEGLDDEQLRRPMVPSGTSLLGMVKHLAYVERWLVPAGLGRPGDRRPLDRGGPGRRLADRAGRDHQGRPGPVRGRVRPQP